MAPHGPILSEDGATPIRMLAICLLGLFDITFDKFLPKMGSGPQGLDLRVCTSGIRNPYPHVPLTLGSEY